MPDRAELHDREADGRAISSLPIGGTAGTLDAITDVAGVEVGHTTLISGSGKLVVGKGPVRTGVTVIHPRGKANPDPVFGAWFTLNGNGEMTGTTWLQESGILEGPIGITNTHSVGVVRDAILQWQVGKPGMQPWGLPVVAETYDGGLNDINGFHVRPEHVIAALDGAKGGPVLEGSGWRWHRHGVPGVQGRDRHGVAKSSAGAGRLHGRRPRAVQLWRAARPAHRRCPGRGRDHRSSAVYREPRPDSRSGRRGTAKAV